MNTMKPAQTGYSRVFLITGRARADHAPLYQSSVKAGAVSQSFGDITKIEVPSPNEFGKFIEVGVIRGTTERATMTLTGRYAADLRSEMLRMARAGCPVDIHINFGACTDPGNHLQYTKKVVMEDARITNYSADDLGALGSDEQAVINESVDVSAKDVYEMVPVTVVERGGSVITAPLLSVAWCGNPSCGDCLGESDGCSTFFAVGNTPTGSPAGPTNLYYSYDGGATVGSAPVTGSTGDGLVGVACIGEHVVVVADTGNYFYAEAGVYSFISGTIAGTPTAVSGDGEVAFIAGEDGYIHRLDSPEDGVVTVEFGALTSNDYTAIATFGSNFAVAGTDAGEVARTKDGFAWGLTVSPVTDEITSIAIKNESEWVIGTDAGEIWATVDGGNTWVEITPAGVSSAAVVSSLSLAN